MGKGKHSTSRMAIMDLFNRTPTPTIVQRASPFSGYPYYDYCLTLPGVKPRTIRLQTGGSNLFALVMCEYRQCIVFGVLILVRYRCTYSSGRGQSRIFDLWCCVIIVEPVGIVSRSGIIGVVVHVMYSGRQHVACLRFIGGCSLGRCVVEAFL